MCQYMSSATQGCLFLAKETPGAKGERYHQSIEYPLGVSKDSRISVLRRSRSSLKRQIRGSQRSGLVSRKTKKKEKRDQRLKIVLG